ncbi:hypothetical protein BKA70DRAFT_1421989 [Coprinopsis sp. MPI-PUGE-AT-0042]|nr:hypothetical protein BKA70DRAFT_1421989 [Coprinopsis sp. MPI-PUGE-AT-0042]
MSLKAPSRSRLSSLSTGRLQSILPEEHRARDAASQGGLFFETFVAPPWSSAFGAPSAASALGGRTQPSTSTFGAPSVTSILGSLISTMATFTFGTPAFGVPAAPAASTASTFRPLKPGFGKPAFGQTGFGRGSTTTAPVSFEQVLDLLKVPPLPTQPLDSGTIAFGPSITSTTTNALAAGTGGSAFSKLSGSLTSQFAAVAANTLAPASSCLVRVRSVKRILPAAPTMTAFGALAQLQEGGIPVLANLGTTTAPTLLASLLRQQRHRCLVNPLNRRPHSQDALSIQQPTKQTIPHPSRQQQGDDTQLSAKRNSATDSASLLQHASVRLQPRNPVSGSVLPELALDWEQGGDTTRT